MNTQIETKCPVVDLFIVSIKGAQWIEVYLLGPDAKRNEQSMEVISWN
jgi:hypothetical protein